MTDRIQRAKSLAIQAHVGQLYGTCTYDVHLEKVQEVLRRFGFDSALVTVNSFEEAVCAAGWVHDVLEDTKVTPEEMTAALGETVTEIASRVTDEPGANREERKKKTYPKIRGNAGATVVKLADRIANFEASLEAQNKHLATYRAEAPGFRSAVFATGIAENMWSYLEALVANSAVNPEGPLRIHELFAALLLKYPTADLSLEQEVRFENEKPGVDHYHIFPRKTPAVGEVYMTYLLDFEGRKATRVVRFRSMRRDDGADDTVP